jgi:hypothetical protein
MPDSALAVWAGVFVVCALYLLVRHWRDDGGVGLLLAYVISFGALHWMTPALYLLPWYWNSRLPLAADGLRESTIALVALTAGAEIAAWVLRPQAAPLLVLPTPDQPGPPPPPPTPVDPRVVTILLVVGVVMYAVVLPLAGGVSSLTALASAGSTLALAGIVLKCWNGWEEGRPGTVLLWIAMSALLPWLTVLTQGFLGYGFAAMLTVFSFAGSFYRPRWKIIVAGCLLGYLGLSVYVTYMRDRRDIRAVVWANATMTSRLDQLEQTVRQAEWFDLHNAEHLDRIEKRLNQDSLIGAGVAYLKANPNEYARGETLWAATVAVIPRALWPDKPIVGGSGDLVSRFTGMKFADNTSVGIGQVMELYVNFATPGIIIGFIVIGALIGTADRLAIRALRRRDALGFTLWFLPGLSLLQVGGSFAEITSTAAAALLVALILRHWANYFAAPIIAEGAEALGPELPPIPGSEASQ